MESMFVAEATTQQKVNERHVLWHYSHYR